MFDTQRFTIIAPDSDRKSGYIACRMDGTHDYQTAPEVIERGVSIARSAVPAASEERGLPFENTSTPTALSAILQADGDSWRRRADHAGAVTTPPA